LLPIKSNIMISAIKQSDNILLGKTMYTEKVSVRKLKILCATGH